MVFNRGVLGYGSHDQSSSDLETKVKTLTNEVEGRTNAQQFEEYKEIFTEDGSPLYTPFCYSPEEIEYFSANSGFLDDEKQETKRAEVNIAVATLDTTPDIQPLPQEEKQNTSYYVEPYEPPIPFPRHLKQHAEEPLVHETMESLKKIRINRLLLKEIRQTDDYAKHMKNFVASKPNTKEDDEVWMNPRCYALLQNQQPPKEQDPRSFILPYNTKSTPKGIVKNLLIKIDNFIFPVDFVIFDMDEDFRMPIILGRPLLATAHAKESYEDIVHRMTEAVKETHLTPKGKGVYWCKAIFERIDVEWEELGFNDWDDMEVNDGEGPKKCGEDKANVILEVALNKLDKAWFDGTNEDEDDLEGIIDYLEPKSYNGFIDLDNKAYNERKCQLLRMTYRKLPPILIKIVEVTRYTIGPGETYTKIKVLGIDEVPRTRDNVATIRARVMKEMAEEGSTQRKTFSQQGNGIRGRTRALEQEARDLDMENKRKNNFEANYGVTTPQELRRNQD
ncbi:hypothetical protein Tco_0700273 [Tanacetum coccineum]